jgi:hypothetical protein
MKKVVEVTFRSVEDFRRRIATLWQDQKDDEVYHFNFLSDEAEKELHKLASCFSKDMTEN